MLIQTGYENNPGMNSVVYCHIVDWFVISSVQILTQFCCFLDVYVSHKKIVLALKIFLTKFLWTKYMQCHSY